MVWLSLGAVPGPPCARLLSPLLQPNTTPGSLRSLAAGSCQHHSIHPRTPLQCPQTLLGLHGEVWASGLEDAPGQVALSPVLLSRAIRTYDAIRSTLSMTAGRAGPAQHWAGGSLSYILLPWGPCEGRSQPPFVPHASWR